MTPRFRGVAAVGVLIALIALPSSSSDGRTQAFESGKTPVRQGYVAPRTPWGDPDLQGKWPGTAMVGVPMQRDPKLGTRNMLNDQEFREREEQYRRQREVDLAEFHLENASHFEALGAIGGPLSAPPHWFERGEPTRLASLIVDPPDGRLPRLTNPARQRNMGMRAARNLRGPADSYSDRNLYDRCLTRGVVGSVLPVIYNNGNEIVQSPGYVVIRHEMIHETRIVPLDGRPHLSQRIRTWMGDSRGHWEGDVLVIETTNLTDRTSIGANGIGQLHSAALKLVERLTRVDDSTILYQVTLDDPKTWVRPWTMKFPWKRDDNYGFFEYACHEGNYSMFNMLSGARADEKAAEAAAGAPPPRN